MKKLFALFGLVAPLLFSGTLAAAPLFVTVTMDENGNISGFPGGHSEGSGYRLPGIALATGSSTSAQGSLKLIEPDTGQVSDEIQFFNDAFIIINSDANPADAGADNGAGSGCSASPGCIIMPEVGDELNNGAIWTPLPGQPGFDTTGQYLITYVFISDGNGPPIPEPATLALLGLGLAGLGFTRRRKSIQA